MNNKGSGCREQRFVPFNKRGIILSIGLLMSSLAHGLTEDGLGDDCLNSLMDKEAPSQNSAAVICTPLQSEPSSSRGVNDRLAQDQTSMKTTGVEDPNEQVSHEQSSDDQDTGQPTEQTADVKDADNPAGLAGSSAVTPQQSIDLFKSDIETPESAEGIETPSSDRDLFNLGLTTLHTTDDFDSRTYSLSYRNHRRDWFWPWQEATDKGIDWGLDAERSSGKLSLTDFQSVHVQGILGTYIASGTYLQGQIGQHTLNTDEGDRTIKSNGVTAMFGLGRDFSAQLATRRDFLYPEGVVPAGISVQMTARDYTASFRWRPHQKLRILGKGMYRKYDDENESHSGELSALYGISPSWPWIWAGVGLQQLSYDQQVANYWSPEEFTAFGLRFDSSFPLSERLSGTAAINVDKLDEDGSTGTGYFLLAGLQYRLTGELYARLDLIQSKSIQSSSTWRYDSAVFKLSGPLF